MAPTQTNSVRDAALAVQEGPKPPSLATQVGNLIQAQSKRISLVLPKGFDETRFTNLVVTACKSKPALLECLRTPQGQVSLLLSVMQAASIGLEPDTPLQEAWLLPRKVKGVQEAQLSIGYVGLLKLARRSGEIKTIYAEVVHENDRFDYQFGTDPKIDHKPAAGERGALTHAYAVARYKDDGFNFIVLDEVAVHARRASSDSWKYDSSRPYSPWTTNTEAMWRKSAIRALRPYLPLTAEAASAIESDERVLTFGEDGSLTPVVDAESEEIAGELDAPDDPEQAAG